MGDNLKIFKLRQDIENVVNSSDLPIMAKRSVLELVLIDVKNISEQVLQEEIEQLAKEQAEKESK